MKNKSNFADFESFKEKEIQNIWCIHGGGDHYCTDCCEEADDPRGGTGEK